MKNEAGLRGCYPPRPSTSVDKNLLDLLNSSYPTQPHSLIAEYTMMNKPIQALEFYYSMIQFFHNMVYDLHTGCESDKTQDTWEYQA